MGNYVLRDLGFAAAVLYMGTWITASSASAQMQKTGAKETCVIVDVRKNWIAKHKEIRAANDVLNSLKTAVKDYKLDDFGHENHSNAQKKQLQQEAVDLFALARETFDKLIDKIASRTTRACEVCALKAVYEMSIAAGLEDVTEDQLREFMNPKKLPKLETLMLTFRLLQAKKAAQETAVKASDQWLKLDGEVQSLSSQILDLRKEMIKGDPPSDRDRFSTEIAKFKC